MDWNGMVIMCRNVEHGLTSEGVEEDTDGGGGGGRRQRAVTSKQNRRIQQLTVQVHKAGTLLCEVC